MPEPFPEPGQVVVDVEWCGICGSDLHEYLKGPLVIPTKESPHKATGKSLPVTLGHEFCGKIRQVTEGVELVVGQHVMVDPRLFCNGCHPCQTQRTNMCIQWGFLGLSGTGGGLSESVAVDARACHVLPQEVDLRFAALIEPLAVARHALRSAGASSFACQNVLILGGGPVGLAVALDLKAHGAGHVFVSEPSSTRRRQVSKHCDVVLDPSQSSIAQDCRDMTNGMGVDIVFDCAGVMPALRAGFDAVKHSGTYVNVSGWEAPPTVPMEFFHMKEVVYRASMSYDGKDFAEVVEDFKKGQFAGVEEMVTARILLDKVCEQGFGELVRNRNHVKILVTPRLELLEQARVPDVV